MSRECGSCTLCCKIMLVPELDKGRNQWCGHCDKGRGCRIYANRPQSCQDFECLWVQDTDIPDDLKPLRSKVVLACTTDGEGIVAHVDPGYPMAAQQGAMGRFLDRLSSKMVVIIACGTRRTLRRPGRQPASYDESIPA